MRWLINDGYSPLLLYKSMSAPRVFVGLKLGKALIAMTKDAFEKEPVKLLKNWRDVFELWVAEFWIDWSLWMDLRRRPEKGGQTGCYERNGSTVLHLGLATAVNISVCKHWDLLGRPGLNLFVDWKISRWHQGPLDSSFQNKTWVCPIVPLGRKGIPARVDPSSPGE